MFGRGRNFKTSVRSSPVTAAFILLFVLSSLCLFIASAEEELSLFLFEPEVDGYTVELNGVQKGAPGQPRWNWGDGTPDEYHWFPNSHTYSSAESYTISVTACNAAGQCITRTKAITVSGQEPRPSQEIKFTGTAVRFEKLIGAAWWVVRVNTPISGPAPCADPIEVHTWSSGWPPPEGYADPAIKPGDRVEVYGVQEFGEGWCHVHLPQAYHYIKRSQPKGKPNLVITDIWFDDHAIYYTIKNIGDATADTKACISCFYSTLHIDGSGDVSRAWDPDLAPGESYTNHFDYEWNCSGSGDQIRVIADTRDHIDESNENDNSREETWQCPVSPLAGFNFYPSQPEVNATVHFADQSRDPDGYIQVWKWEFGDGETSTSQNPTHHYREAGTYKVCLAVADNSGATAEACKDITVIPSRAGEGKRVLWHGSGTWGVRSSEGCRQFKQKLEEQGYSADSTSDLGFGVDWKRKLKEYDVLVLATLGFLTSEIREETLATINIYVAEGGKLLLLVDSGSATSPTVSLTHYAASELGVQLSDENLIIKDTEHNFPACYWPSGSRDPKSWFCPLIEKGNGGWMAEHPITQDVEKIYLHEASWYIRERGPSTVIAKTSADSYAEDRSRARLQPLIIENGPLSILAYLENDNGGRVVVLTDTDALCIMLDTGDNLQLGLNIIDWLIEGGGAVEPEPCKTDSLTENGITYEYTICDKEGQKSELGRIDDDVNDKHVEAELTEETEGLKRDGHAHITYRQGDFEITLGVNYTRVAGVPLPKFPDPSQIEGIDDLLAAGPEIAVGFKGIILKFSQAQFFKDLCYNDICFSDLQDIIGFVSTVISSLWGEKSTSALRAIADCPVDLVVTDPQGDFISKEGSQIPGAVYLEVDIDNDGEAEDVVIIVSPRGGDYSIDVIPEPGASPTDTYSLEVSVGGQTTTLADEVQIKDIPDEAYIFTSKQILSAIETVVAEHSGDPTVIEDADIIWTIRLWIFGVEVPGAGGQTISDEKILELIELWISGQPTTYSSAQREAIQIGGNRSLIVRGIKFFPNPIDNAARLAVEGTGIAGIKVEIFNLAGGRVFKQKASGRSLELHLMDSEGCTLANGVYLYLVTVEGFDGEEIRSEVRKLIVLR